MPVEEAWELAVVSGDSFSEDKEAGRYIPVDIRRRLLEECGYRCSVPTCRGTSALQFEHIEDWATLIFKNHDFDKMIILCATCHARVTSKEIHKNAVRAYKRNLAITNGRYSLYEMRMMKAFFEAYENRFVATGMYMSTLPIEGTDELEIEGFFYIIPRTDGLQLQGLLDDELILIELNSPRFEKDKMLVTISEKGRVFLTDYFSGNKIE